METEIIAQNAIVALEKQTNIKMKWEPNAPKDLDGKVAFKHNKKQYHAFVTIKKELRNHQLPYLLRQNESHHPLIVMAEYISPKLKEELRKEDIGYLETNGNIYFNEGDLLLWLDGQKVIPPETEKAGRAFTKTGLKLVFHFLINEDLVNETYREIALKTGVGFGNINVIISDLKKQGFLLPKDKNSYFLNNRKELLNKWMIAYKEKLKPSLLVATFRFLTEEDRNHWKKLSLKEDKTWWGGEPAADLLTNFLHPGEYTLYTLEKRADIIRHYRLVSDANGNVKVFQKFWQDNANDSTVPPLLVYVDLVNTGDRRCIETAQKIYDEYLQDKF
ncbi:type IV toxin-antitoxin system AbiEi family antitoxin [Chitinophaga sp. ARDCPP14]|uniref:type IV toxin-antitoxin system AbiEi family antitoxin n=1 Tax=Chitinophaga sp. ARDCPP14 TaxID=3391139 RepID=UPI003F51C26D